MPSRASQPSASRASAAERSTAARTPRARAAMRWWLICDSRDVCCMCGHGYAYGTEGRCGGCDAVICAVCYQAEVHCEDCR